MSDLRLPEEFDLPPRRLALRRDRLVQAVAPNAASHPVRPRRRVLVAVALKALIAIGATATAIVLAEDVESPPGLEPAIQALFPSDRCILPDEGMRLVRTALDRLGLSDWTIRANPTNANEPCTQPGFDPEGRRVILVRTTSPEVQRAVDVIGERMWTECFDEREARDVLGQELERLGVKDWSIRLNEGISVTRDAGEARFRHYSKGCFVLAGAVREEAEPGAVTYFIASGNDS